MTTLEIIAGLLIALVAALVYFLGEAYAEIAKIRDKYNDKMDRLNDLALECEHLKKKLEKISEIAK